MSYFSQVHTRNTHYEIQRSVTHYSHTQYNALLLRFNALLLTMKFNALLLTTHTHTQLVTGDLLFDPHEGEGYDRDEVCVCVRARVYVHVYVCIV